jgi:hypothetical protein
MELGDEIAPGKFRGWAGFLATNFQDGCEYFNFSRPGAKSTEVGTIQLEKAIAQQPDICAVIVGGNDLLPRMILTRFYYIKIYKKSVNLYWRLAVR